MAWRNGENQRGPPQRCHNSTHKQKLSKACRSNTQWCCDSMRCPVRKVRKGTFLSCQIEEIKLLFHENTEILKVHFCMLLVPMPGVPIPCGLQKCRCHSWFHWSQKLSLWRRDSMRSANASNGSTSPNKGSHSNRVNRQLLLAVTLWNIKVIPTSIWVSQNSHSRNTRQILSNAPIPPIGVPMPASLEKACTVHRLFCQGCNYQSSRGVPVPELPRPPTGVDEPPPLLDHPVSYPKKNNPVDGLSSGFPYWNPLPAGNFVSVGGRVYLSANKNMRSWLWQRTAAAMECSHLVKWESHPFLGWSGLLFLQHLQKPKLVATGKMLKKQKFQTFIICNRTWWAGCDWELQDHSTPKRLEELWCGCQGSGADAAHLKRKQTLNNLVPITWVYKEYVATMNI